MGRRSVGEEATNTERSKSDDGRRGSAAWVKYHEERRHMIKDRDVSRRDKEGTLTSLTSLSLSGRPTHR